MVTPCFSSPLHQLFTDVFGAVINPYSGGFAAPFDDPVQAADDAFGGQGEIDLDPGPLAVKVVEHVQQPKASGHRRADQP